MGLPLGLTQRAGLESQEGSYHTSGICFGERLSTMQCCVNQAPLAFGFLRVIYRGPRILFDQPKRSLMR
jgi:hypothetical protein